MSYYDSLGFGSMLAISGVFIIVGWLIKWVNVGAIFGRYLMAIGTIVFILVALFGMIRMIKPPERN